MKVRRKRAMMRVPVFQVREGGRVRVCEGGMMRGEGGGVVGEGSMEPEGVGLELGLGSSWASVTVTGREEMGVGVRRGGVLDSRLSSSWELVGAWASWGGCRRRSLFAALTRLAMGRWIQR